ncbi:MAG: 4Fe-4S dicluster domain-containing protein [Desulfobacterales bacterium]|nr:4Fe-4S dicluster domain-containing protein [Desulfobacterales bacterium]
MKIVYVEQDRCLACRNCERVCSFQRAGGFRQENTNIWVHIDLDARSIFTMTCLQCESAICMEVCPATALQRNPETKAVTVNEHQCVGCKMCIAACPFGCLHFENLRQVAVKCDLCDGDPACVKTCMAGALHYADINELAQRKRRKIDLKLSKHPFFLQGLFPK